ncbi:MAG: TonB-dependent receptor plug [Chitinophagaceae bacterium]|nr:TonB-dependent receptor plug [Chitinophagaceae bacterium]
MVFLWCGCSSVFSQTITILSAEEKEAIPHAHIIYTVLSTQQRGTVLCTVHGKASLDSLPIFFPLAIEISSVGYKKYRDTLYSSSNKTYYTTAETTVPNEVVVTAQYAANSVEKSVYKVKIIDRKKIDLQGAQNLRDILSNEMNVRISQDNILGSSMSLQGVSGQNVKIMIDGVPMIGRQNGNLDLSQINLNNTERIEIVEGPLSVNYGSDALAGTINIITRKNQRQIFSSSVNTYYESIGQYNASGRIGYQKNKNRVSLSGGRNYFDGWQNGEPAFHVERTALADSTRSKSWKPKEQYFTTLNIGRQIKGVQAGYTTDLFYEKITNKGVPRTPYNESGFDDYYTTYRYNNSISLNGKLSKNYNINFVAAYNYYKRIKNTYYIDLTTLNQTLTTNEGDQDTSVFKTMMSRASISNTNDSSAVNYEIGYDLNHDSGYGIQIASSHQSIGDYASFGSLEYHPIRSLVIRPGLRYSYNTAYTAPVVPSLNIKWMHKSFTFRLAYAKGFRAPAIKELYFYFVDINHNIKGNPSLQAEHSNNYSGSLVWQKTFDQKAYKAEFSAFYNQINNLITLALISAANTEYSYINVGNYQTKGISLNTELATQHVKLSVGGSYTGRYNILSQTSDVPAFSYSPELRSNLFYEWKKARLTIALFYKYNGSLPAFAIDDNNQVYQNTIQAYHMADASVTKYFLNKRISVSLGSKNLFNVKNINGSSTGDVHSAGTNSLPVAMGRTYFIKLDIVFNK